MNKSRYLAVALAAAAACAIVAPANAALTVVLDCSVVGLNDINPNAQQCVGYYDGNQLTTSAGGSASADEVQALGLLGLTAPPTITVLEKLENVSSINFGTLLNGVTYIGIHYGGGGDVPQGNSGGLTAFYRFNAGTNLDIVTTQFSNLSGVSLYKTGVPGVPEPTSWAMMLVGFGIIGFGMRRRQNIGTSVSFG